MIVGITGTDKGLSGAQLQTLTELLERGGRVEDRVLHHGDCVGADAQADALGRWIGYRIVVHPPDNPKKRAYCGRMGDTILTERPYLKRNLDIAKACEVLYAVVTTTTEQWRGNGEWATIRYARKLGKRVAIIPPNGRVLWD